jgi:ABC-type multidrug transport system fused ATPase/permease subunit
MEKVTTDKVRVGIRVIWREMTARKKVFTLLTVGTIFSALGNGSIPFITGKLIDTLTSSNTYNLFGHPFSAFTVLITAWACIQVVTYAIDWKMDVAHEIVGNDVWSSYISRGSSFLLTLPISFHKREKIGEVNDRIQRAANNLDTIVGKILISTVPQLFSIVVAIGLVLFIKPLFAFLLMIGVLFYLITMATSMRSLGAVQSKFWDLISEAFGDSYDRIANTHAIKQSTAEKYEQKNIKELFVGSLPLWFRITNAWAHLNFLQRVVVLCTQTAILILSLFAIRTGSMTIGELLALNAYTAMVFGPFIVLARNWQTIHTGIINIDAAERVLSLAPENYEPKGSKPFDIKGNVTFKDVSFSYEEGKQVLSSISFNAEAGEVIAFVGESGVGKSTTIDFLGGYHFPTTGSVLIDGVDMKAVNLHSLRSQMAVVPQEVVLFNNTIQANIKYGSFEATDAEITEAARRAHALEFIEKFPNGWNQLVGERGVKLSVGQKQRVALARAILRKPKILILDEPTSALDAGSEKIISDSLNELMKGRTTFIIAHRLSTVRKANKILVFKEGKIIESGTHQKLLKIEGGEYRRLYELQIGLHE